MFPLMFLFALIWAIFPTFSFFLHSRNFNRKSIETTGEILSIDEKNIVDSDGDSRIKTYAKVKFNTILNEIISENELPNDNYQIGNTIKVYYDPEFPEKTYFERVAPEKPFLYLAGIFTLLIGLIVIIYNAEILKEIRNPGPMIYVLLGITIIEICIMLFSKRVRPK